MAGYIKLIMTSKSKHWDRIFSDSEDASLGWFETDLTTTFRLLDEIENWQESTLFISGAGTSLLIDALMNREVSMVINDISCEALTKLKKRLGHSQQSIDWLCQDIAQPFQQEIATINIWLDRAVLHFLTEETNINGYFNNLKQHLVIKGYAIFAEFSTIGATQCAGLKIHQYSVEELSQRLGSTFKLMTHFESTFINSGGNEKPYIYALYQKIA